MDKHPYDAIERLKDETTVSSNKLFYQQKARITEFLDKINFYPDVIVMDIEGFEVDVIEDLLLGNNRPDHQPIILFEIHERLYDADKGLEYLQKILKDNNYHLIKIRENMLCIKV